MHQSQSYIDSTVIPTYPGIQLTHIALNGAHASGLQDRLKDDALGYCYSGVVSIADALRGVTGGFYSWSTVKLYYAAFYLARSLLAMKGITVFYSGKSPHQWNAVAGKTPKKLKGTTHQVVLDEFAAAGTHPPLLTQQIGGVPPLTWLREQREHANYGKPRFEEPDAPNHFDSIIRHGVRKSVEAYILDTTFLYAFDPDHAMAAYPLEMLRATFREVKALPTHYAYSNEDKAFLAGLIKDDKGRLPTLDRLVKV